jgi:hypothetical protein
MTAENRAPARLSKLPSETASRDRAGKATKCPTLVESYLTNRKTVSGGAPESRGSLWKVSASGGTPERMTVGGDDVANPAISSRGNRSAYEQRRQDANIWQIEVPTATQALRGVAWCLLPR